MSGSSVYSEAVNYLTDDRKRWYRNMLREVKNACEDAKAGLGKNVVSTIYSREDKQNGEVLKSAASIAGKVERIRSRGEKCDIKDIYDIIGITIVVQYSDQIPDVIEHLEKKLTARNIYFINKKEMRTDGYFATHLNLKSEDLNFPGFCCEIQIKTMLHDALANKMHDLNYKPDGELDQRLDFLMKTLATSLEAIEMQSQIIRDLISESKFFEDEWREASHARMFRDFPQFEYDGETQICREFLEKNKEFIEKWESHLDVYKEALFNASALADNNIRAGWILLTFIGVTSRNFDARRYAATRIQDWINYAINKYSEGNELDYAEVWLAPLALMALAHPDEAISCSKNIITKFSDMPPMDMMITKFNLANFLVQREYFQNPKKSESDIRKEEINSLINECEELEKLDRSAFEDLRGMLLVCFAECAEEVSEGIELINHGKNNATDKDKELAEIFHALHSRLAWRRLLHLEDTARRLRYFSRGEEK